MAEKEIKFQAKEIDAFTKRALANNVLVEGARPLSWWKRQSNEMHSKFMNEMRTSIENGESVQKAAVRVRGGTVNGVQVPGIMKATKARAQTLSRTAINKVSNEARIQSFEANDDVIKAIKQISTLDNRTSLTCVAYDGQVWENTPDKKPIAPSTLPFNGGPPRHFNCRSTLTPVLKSWKELGIPAKELSASSRASMDGQVPADQTFSGFLKGKTQRFQNELLGKTKARLWRTGKIKLSQLVDFRGNPLSDAELLKLAKKAKKATAAAVAAAPKPAPPPPADAGPYQKAGEPSVANEWHKASWINMPKYLREALDDVPPLAGMRNLGRTAHYNPKTYANADEAIINMSKQHELGKRLSWGTWRHEYGHHIDYVYARRLTEAEFLDANRQISWSRPMREKFKEDLASVMTAAGKTRPTRVKKLDAADDVFQGHLSKTMDKGTDYLDTQFKKYGTSYEEMRRIHRQNMDDSVDGPNDAIMRNKMVHLLTAMETKNVNYYIKNVWQDHQFYHSGINGKILDYYGSLTKNKVGMGHSIEYYSKGPHWQSTEMFANAVCLLGDDPAWSKVVRGLGHSKFYDGVEDLLKSKGKQ